MSCIRKENFHIYQKFIFNWKILVLWIFRKATELLFVFCCSDLCLWCTKWKTIGRRKTYHTQGTLPYHCRSVSFRLQKRSVRFVSIHWTHVSLLVLVLQLEVMEIALDQCGQATERRLAIIDKNRDLYLTSVRVFGSERKSNKLGRGCCVCTCVYVKYSISGARGLWWSIFCYIVHVMIIL